ncbi:WD repeat-containing protein 88-like isoform X1 [Mugil cephalus]|uniref:WD repeat-containing protein 88-like isoform X1 n=1 Tax=Mugil cephalus TaxID=48193 RepID=UPI001FB6EC56|nr:WD repeat-containing protein 88-like isoform X1 [Mugil cephalus]
MASKNNFDPLSVEDPPGGGGEEEKEEEEEGGEESTLESRVPVKVLRFHRDVVTSVQLCFSDRCVLSVSSDVSAVLWDVQTGRPLRTFEGVHSSSISDCALVPNSNRMVTVSWDKKIVLWDMETGQVLWSRSPAGLLTSCSTSSDGLLLVCASDPQNGVYVCQTSSGQTLHALNGLHRSTITRCRFDPQSLRVSTVSADRLLKLWDLRNQRSTLSTHSNHSNVVSDCCFTSNGHFLATASWDKTLKLWDLHGGGFRSQGGTTLRGGHEGSVSCCNFSADDRLLVSGSYDRTVAFWDTASLVQTLVLKGHRDGVTGVSISSDGTLLASSSKDGTVRLWDVEKMEDVPAVMKKKMKTEGTGAHIIQCERCAKPFPVSRPLTSELVSRCVFCRLDSPSRYQPQPPEAPPLE